MINAIEYIARYIRLLKRHNALLALHASSSRGCKYAFIGIATKQRFVRFKLRVSYVVMETTRNYIKNFDSVNNILLTEELAETYKSKVFAHDVKQFGEADKWKLYDAVGATVVAPSDFQSVRHQKPNNQ
ncbi:hypothetical protein [Fibrobacter sp.]|uniref:hypothetical protein n=1 Tax=Fibrobacter sp. TaxID=35828 RepID=UPI0025C223A0|nr:hypothetical protein [Fibrobacter sp.]MBR4007498.1 hypothetical protein [Fibrobacter sp.]